MTNIIPGRFTILGDRLLSNHPLYIWYCLFNQWSDTPVKKFIAHMDREWRMVYKRGMRFSRAETLCNELLHQFEGLHFNRDPGSWMNQSDRCSSIWLPILTAVKIILNLQTVRYYTVRQKKIKPELSLLNVLFMYRACGYLGQWVHCSRRRSAIALVGFV